MILSHRFCFFKKPGDHDRDIRQLPSRFLSQTILEAEVSANGWWEVTREISILVKSQINER